MSATRSNASIRRGRLVAIAALLTLVTAAAGCGGGDSSNGTSTATDGSAAGVLEQALYELGDTQEVVCESLGDVEVSGSSREVARCSFTEEKDDAGEMRARGGCFVLENGSPLDVTMDVPADVTCFTKT